MECRRRSFLPRGRVCVRVLFVGHTPLVVSTTNIVGIPSKVITNLPAAAATTTTITTTTKVVLKMKEPFHRRLVDRFHASVLQPRVAQARNVS